MKYFYSASAMGYGDGRWWHRFYKFPNHPRVTKTLTLGPKIGKPYAVIKIGNSVYNNVGLSNMGLKKWIECYSGTDLSKTIVSLHSENVTNMVVMFAWLEDLNIRGIEMNLSCPNIKRRYPHFIFPPTKHDLYLKLNYLMNPYMYDLDVVKGIRLNSIPLRYCGGGSGKVAQKRNWEFIKKYGKELSVAGCSFQTLDDIHKLEDMGCTEIGIGSTILTNPKLVEWLNG